MVVENVWKMNPNQSEFSASLKQTFDETIYKLTFPTQKLKPRTSFTDLGRISDRQYYMTLGPAFACHLSPPFFPPALIFQPTTSQTNVKGKTRQTDTNNLKMGMSKLENHPGTRGDPLRLHNLSSRPACTSIQISPLRCFSDKVAVAQYLPSYFPPPQRSILITHNPRAGDCHPPTPITSLIRSSNANSDHTGTKLDEIKESRTRYTMLLSKKKKTTQVLQPYQDRMQLIVLNTTIAARTATPRAYTLFRLIAAYARLTRP